MQGTILGRPPRTHGLRLGIGVRVARTAGTRRWVYHPPDAEYPQTWEMIWNIIPGRFGFLFQVTLPGSPLF